MIEGVSEPLGSECSAGKQLITDAPACQTGASWAVSANGIRRSKCGERQTTFVKSIT